MTYRKKLIEVALPLDAINKEAKREKAIHYGHPSNLHIWWARRPLAACRAVLFASLVDDPSEHPQEFPTEQDQDQERERLFRLIEELVKWENSNNENILQQARSEILKSTAGNPPPVLDPFAGGGSIPLEAQRLGLKVHASDLNPVAVLINKALIEIPSKFAGYSPVNPKSQQSLIESDWHGTRGLVEDIRYYGKWIRDEAEQRIGYLYPRITLPKEHGGSEATVIAWLWARTVKCPNPACGKWVPLTRSFWLCKKKGKYTYIEPKIDHLSSTISFEVRYGKDAPEGTINRQGARCTICSTFIDRDYLSVQGRAKQMGAQLVAIVAEGKGGRVYLPPREDHIAVAKLAIPNNVPETALPEQALGFRTQHYGLTQHRDLFTSRQLVALTTFSDLVSDAHRIILADAIAAGLANDKNPIDEGGIGATAYTDAITTYLSMNVCRLANRCSTICFWDTTGEKVQQVFARQAISMTWDFVEGNPFSDSSGNFLGQIDYMISAIEASSRGTESDIKQHDAVMPFNSIAPSLVSTDPPYYDNISYSDLSDFFYIWLRRSLNKIYPELFSTVLVPKLQELIASPFRFSGDKDQARRFFEKGLGKAFTQIHAVQHRGYPLTVYYAFKQSESDIDEDIEENKNSSVTASTGWETMLEGLLKSCFQVTGTWPMRTEITGNLKKNRGALASSIVIVCRPRPVDAPIASRREFLNALRAELPNALKKLQHGSIAPVDLAQASIGPGMSIYSRYSKVVESDGTPLRVRTALQLINRALDEALAEQEGEYDAETRWAIAWFEQYAMNAGEYGVAETLSKAKNTTVQSLVDAGLLEARGGKVRLLKREEFPQAWMLKDKSHLTAWEVMQRMIHALLNGSGESGAGDILRQVSEQAEVARDLAYRLYTVCERKGWAQEALAYNSLVTSWSEISRLAHREPEGIRQASFLG